MARFLLCLFKFYPLVGRTILLYSQGSNFSPTQESEGVFSDLEWENQRIGRES